MKAIRLEKTTMGNYRVFIDGLEVELNGVVLDAERAILEALKSRGVRLTLSTQRGEYIWSAPYWTPIR